MKIDASIEEVTAWAEEAGDRVAGELEVNAEDMPKFKLVEEMEFDKYELEYILRFFMAFKAMYYSNKELPEDIRKLGVKLLWANEELLTAEASTDLAPNLSIKGEAYGIRD